MRAESPLRGSEPVLGEGWLFALAAAGSLAVSLPRVCRELVLMGDSAELTAAAHVWGVPRAPGYPLWTALAHLASLVPVGSPAFRVNLTSAAFHAIAIGFVALSAQRLSRSLAGGAAAAVSLSLANTFLFGSLYAEAFPLNDALFAALLWLAIRAEDRRGILLLFGTAGLALAHHELALLALPAVAILAFRAMRRHRSPGWKVALAALLPFVASQGLLWLAYRRAPAVSSCDLGSGSGWVELLLRSEWGGLFGWARAATSEPVGERLGAMALVWLANFGPIALASAVVGVLALLRERRDLCLGLSVAVALPGPLLAALYRGSVDGEVSHAVFERLSTMALVPIAVLAGVGVAAAVRRVPRSWPAARALPLALSVVPALPVLVFAPRVDMSRDAIGGAFARDLLRGVPDGALVLVSGDLYSGAARYRCAALGECASVDVVAPGMLSRPFRRAQHELRHPTVLLPEGRMSLARAHELVERELPRRPVFVAPTLLTRAPELGRRFAFSPERLLARVYADDAAAAADLPHFVRVVAGMADGTECEGCALAPNRVTRPSQHVTVLLTYSSMMENASRRALRAGADDAGRSLEARFREIDAAVGPQLSFSPGGYNP